jgi:hypothetical protein
MLDGPEPCQRRNKGGAVPSRERAAKQLMFVARRQAIMLVDRQRQGLEQRREDIESEVRELRHKIVRMKRHSDEWAVRTKRRQCRGRFDQQRVDEHDDAAWGGVDPLDVR